MNVPELWIIAGPNGAGKTTCSQMDPIREIVGDIAFLNPDDVTVSKLRSLGYPGFAAVPETELIRLFVESANEISQGVLRAIQDGERVGVETVLSTLKYQPHVREVQQRNGFFGLIYVALSSSELAQERVSIRVKSGGHDVPVDRIADRWQRSLNNLSCLLNKPRHSG